MGRVKWAAIVALLVVAVGAAAFLAHRALHHSTALPPVPPSRGLDLAANGGFSLGGAYWSLGPARSATRFDVISNDNSLGTMAYSGVEFAAVRALASGAGISQRIPAMVSLGATYCASAEVVTIGRGPTGAAGSLTLSLVGDGAPEVETTSFSHLPNGSDWRPVSGCITATSAHSAVVVAVLPKSRGAAIGVDDVDVQPDLAANGNFGDGAVDWSTDAGTQSTGFNISGGAGTDGTRPFSGATFASVSTGAPGGGISQRIPERITAGTTYCASAQLVTIGSAGGSGNFTLALTGGARTDTAARAFSDLPAGNTWMPASTCVTATTAHTGLVVGVAPQPNGPAIGVDDVDVQPGLVLNGAFSEGLRHWTAGTGPLATKMSLVENGDDAGTSAYSGNAFAAVSTTNRGGGIYQKIPLRIRVTDTYCVSAEVVAVSSQGEAAGSLSIELTGGDATDSSTVTFHRLPHGDDWTPVSTCVTATSSGSTLTVSLRPDDRGGAVGLDDVEVQAKSFGVSYPGLSVITTSIPPATLDRPYRQSLSGGGGAPPYAWAISSGELPAGLRLSKDGLISGVPTALCSCSFTADVTDASLFPFTASVALKLAVTQFEVSSRGLRSATFGHSYSSSLTATGGIPPYTYSVLSGTLPAGMTLSPSGILAGTPAAVGTTEFTIEAVDDSDPPLTGVRAVKFTVLMGISPASLPGAMLNQPYAAQLNATGANSPCTWEVVSGALPAGLGLSSGGTISGTPTAAGPSTFTVRVTDSSQPAVTATKKYTLTASAPISPANLPYPTVGKPYSQDLSVDGSAQTYVWTISSGSLPTGLALSPSGIISGTPNTASTYKFTVTASDPATHAVVAVQTFKLMVRIAVSPLPLPQGRVGYPYSITLGAVGGTAPYTWSISAGTVPPGLSLSSSGVLSGIPQAAGSYAFTISVIDSSNPAVSTRQNVELSVTTAATP